MSTDVLLLLGRAGRGLVNVVLTAILLVAAVALTAAVTVRVIQWLNER